MEQVNRCYRYSLVLADVQVAAIRTVAREARGYWSGLVAVQRWAEREIRASRQASLIANYGTLLQAKALTRSCRVDR